jgi:hypothetical protein
MNTLLSRPIGSADGGEILGAFPGPDRYSRTLSKSRQGCATEFKQRCRGLGIVGVAPRIAMPGRNAPVPGYPMRFAQEAWGVLQAVTPPTPGRPGASLDSWEVKCRRVVRMPAAIRSRRTVGRADAASAASCGESHLQFAMPAKSLCGGQETDSAMPQGTVAGGLPRPKLDTMSPSHQGKLQ